MPRLAILSIASLLAACSPEPERPMVFIDGEGTVVEQMQLALAVATELGKSNQAGAGGDGRVGTDGKQASEIRYSAGYSKERFLWFEESERAFISCDIPDESRRAVLTRVCVERIEAALAAHRGNATRSDGARSN